MENEGIPGPEKEKNRGAGLLVIYAIFVFTALAVGLVVILMRSKGLIEAGQTTAWVGPPGAGSPKNVIAPDPGQAVLWVISAAKTSIPFFMAQKSPHIEQDSSLSFP